MKNYDVIIIGAGPAGVFCAISLKEKNLKLKIAIIEKGKPLIKLVQSGGGRCNLSNKKANAKNCIPYYPRGSRFISHLFYQYDVECFCKWLSQNKIDVKIEQEEKIFLKSDDSKQLETVFMQKLRNYNIDLIKGEFIDFKINLKNDSIDENRFEVVLKENVKGNFGKESEEKIEKQSFYSNFLVISSGSNREVLKKIESKGIITHDFIPSLYGFKIKEIEEAKLAGITLKDISVYLEPQSKDEKGNINIEVNNGDEIRKMKKRKSQKVNGDLLFTHEGLSGPAILKLSSYYAIDLYNSNFKGILHIDFYPNKTFEELEKEMLDKCHKGAKIIKNICNEMYIAENLWGFLLEKVEICKDILANQIKKEQIKRLIKILKDFKVEVNDKSMNKEEFVSAGGIDLDEIDKQCKSKKINRLYFIGEILNIDGITGGYNLQSCWTTSYVCADSIAKLSCQNPK